MDQVEHIVVDGASTDGTVELLKEAGVRWISEPDNGMYDAINKGLLMANGDIIGYVNADDRLTDGALKIIYNVFASDTSIDFVYGRCTYVDSSGSSLATFRPSPLSLRLRARCRITFAQPTVFWRRSLHDHIGYFNSEFKTAGDADFFYKLLSGRFRGRSINKTLATFMVRDDALSTASAREMHEEMKRIRATYRVSRISAPYLANEIGYYLVNIKAYLQYFWRRRIRNRATLN